MNKKRAALFLLIGFAVGQLPMYINAAKIDANEFQNSGIGIVGIVVTAIIALSKGEA